MNLNSGKIFRNAYILPIFLLVMGLVMGIVFYSISQFEDIWTLIPIFFILGLSLIMGAVIPFMNLRTYKKAGEDQFNLLIRKPMIQYDIDSKELAAEIELSTKKGAKPKGTEMICPYCGKIVAKDAKICENCGTDID